MILLILICLLLQVLAAIDNQFDDNATISLDITSQTDKIVNASSLNVNQQTFSSNFYREPVEVNEDVTVSIILPRGLGEIGTDFYRFVSAKYEGDEMSRGDFEGIYVEGSNSKTKVPDLNGRGDKAVCNVVGGNVNSLQIQTLNKIESQLNYQQIDGVAFFLSYTGIISSGTIQASVFVTSTLNADTPYNQLFVHKGEKNWVFGIDTVKKRIDIYQVDIKDTSKPILTFRNKLVYSDASIQIASILKIEYNGTNCFLLSERELIFDFLRKNETLEPVEDNEEDNDNQDDTQDNTQNDTQDNTQDNTQNDTQDTGNTSQSATRVLQEDPVSSSDFILTHIYSSYSNFLDSSGPIRASDFTIAGGFIYILQRDVGLILFRTSDAKQVEYTYSHPFFSKIDYFYSSLNKTGFLGVTSTGSANEFFLEFILTEPAFPRVNRIYTSSSGIFPNPIVTDQLFSYIPSRKDELFIIRRGQISSIDQVLMKFSFSCKTQSCQVMPIKMLGTTSQAFLQASSEGELFLTTNLQVEPENMLCWFKAPGRFDITMEVMSELCFEDDRGKLNECKRELQFQYIAIEPYFSRSYLVISIIYILSLLALIALLVWICKETRGCRHNPFKEAKQNKIADIGQLEAEEKEIANQI